MIKFPAFGQRNNEGPPDLDKILSDLNQKINNLFGKKSANNNQPSSNKEFDVPVLPILAVIAAIWLATGFYIVDQGSLGVVQRFGKYTQTTEPGPRWHWPFPIESAEVVNMEQVRRLEVGYRSSGDGAGGKTRQPKEALMLTEDENIIDMQVAVQYKLKNAKDYLFNNRSTDESVMSAAETAIREIVGKSKLDDLLQKGLPDTSERMQAILDSYKTGVLITSVSRQKGAAPEQVKEAFDDVNRANQDYQRQINEGQAYANDVIPKARGNASRLAAEASGYKLKARSLRPRITVSLVSASCSTWKHGSSSLNRCRAMASFCSWPLLAACTARPNIGFGNAIGDRWISSSSWLSCSTASTCRSSTFAIAAMSPGIAWSISMCSLPLSLNR